MKLSSLSFFLGFLLLVSCKSNPYGKRMKDPMQGSRYESNARFFRAVGKAQSRDESIAVKKARNQAKAELAGQIQTRIREMVDEYESETGFEGADEITGKFQSLTRALVNTDISDLRVIDEQKYVNGDTYTAFVAYEIKKNAMFRFLKKQARVNAKIDEKSKKQMEDLIDRELKRLEEADR